MEEEKEDKRKPHRDRHAGRKAEKKKSKNSHVEEQTDKQRNPKAFTFNSAVRAERKFRRTQDIRTKKQHIPVVDRTPLEPPPVMVVVVGPPKVGKTTLIHCLIKTFTRQPLTTIKGPVTVISGKKRRITFIECNNDINSMIDLAKIADLVLLLIDASFGFEMEIFEFLNICQVHGMPKIMGVLTHLDMLKNTKVLKRTKKTLKHRFWTEVYAGAKLFYLSGLLHNEYLRNEVKNLGRFISVMKFRPLTWQTTHPYMLADRMEDITGPEFIRQNPKADRTVCLYGYVRGIPLNKSNSIHIPGCGDMKISDVCFLPDPCPLPDKLKKRSLVEKERFIYAPFSGVGGIVYDKDAVYIELAGSHSHHNQVGGRDEAERDMVTSLLDTRNTLDEKIARSQLQMFSGAAPITNSEFVTGQTVKEVRIKEEKIDTDDGRTRRKVIFPNEDIKDENDSDDEEEISADEESSEKEEDEQNLNHQSTVVNVDSDEEKDDIDDLLEKSKIAEVKEMPENCKDIHESKRKFDNFESDSDSEQSESDEDFKTPTKKKKLNNEVKENIARYHTVRSNKDTEIRDKISGALAMFTDPKDQESIVQGDSAFSDNDSSDEEDNDSKIMKQENRDKKLQYDSSDDSDSNNEEYSDLELDEDNQNSHSKRNLTQIRSEESSESEEYSDMKEEMSDTTAVNWKTNLAQKAADAFIERQTSTANLWKLVYGNESLLKREKEKDNDSEEEETEVGGLFRVVSKKQEQKQQERDTLNAPDVSKFPITHIRDWSSKEAQNFIKDCFVTGKWKKSEDASELLRLDSASDFDGDDDEEVFGDFEDLETGEKHSGKSKKNNHSDDEKGGDDEPEKKPSVPLTKAQLMEKKLKLREKFNAEYDDKGDDAPYYDELKQEVTKQAELNRTEFEGLDDAIRVQLEGYRAGMYIRVEISSVPCELVTNFDPTFPLIIGGLQAGEENVGYVKVRIKKHRWYKKILKNKNPLIISLGWRRFQTLPIYSKLEDNLRHRMLKYTPEHVACMAHFWGPLTRASTGFLAVQDVASNESGFRIVATGSVVDTNQSVEVTKKLKLTGTPLKIYKKTAFIQGMFNSLLEVAKFEGARIKTVSGIRGQIKKGVNKPEGAFRATFEDKIQLSGGNSKLYNPVTSLLLPVDEKNQWRGMKTVGQLKRERGIKSEPQVDSMYKPIVREEPVFKPMSVPRQLQKQLPYKTKPKLCAKNKEIKRVAVVRDIHESKVASMMKKLQTVYKHKQKQEKIATRKRLQEYRKQIEDENKRKLGRQKEMKKDVFRTLSKLEAKNKGKQS